MANKLISQTGSLRAAVATDLVELESNGGVSAHGDIQSVLDLAAAQGISVSDGSVTVNPTTGITFTGLPVVDFGGGQAGVGPPSGGGSPPFDLVGADTFTALGATPGNYTLDNSGIVVKNDDGDEVFRIWGTDPEEGNPNSQNLYIGLQAGLNQPTDNVDAGFDNIGIGTLSLAGAGTGRSNIGIGTSTLTVVGNGGGNIAIGSHAGEAVSNEDNNGDNILIGNYTGTYITTGTQNVMVGAQTGDNIIEGINNTALGVLAGPDGDFSNTISIGDNVQAPADNTTVIGNTNQTDVYLGTDDGHSILHCKGDAIVMPDIDSGVPASGVWVNNLLVKSGTTPAVVQSVSSGVGVSVDNTDAANPIINSVLSFTDGAVTVTPAASVTIEGGTITDDGAGAMTVLAPRTVRNAAEVPSGPPAANESYLAFDSTPVTGGPYFWDGGGWVKMSSIA